ncbi:transposase [Pseudomonas taiwanensis]|uniref:transposase n=1 Tax=Pseudomonas taiwanensis TaxID=470150 RepID=UPI0021177C0D|nr:transposase [Pseudomonas taiwanensis]
MRKSGCRKSVEVVASATSIRWEHESVLDAMQSRLDQAPEIMRIGRQPMEHPFGTLKTWMGATHFLTKTLDRVSTEMRLHVLVYNFKRMLNLMGNSALMAAIKA